MCSGSDWVFVTVVALGFRLVSRREERRALQESRLHVRRSFGGEGTRCGCGTPRQGHPEFGTGGADLPLEAMPRQLVAEFLEQFGGHGHLPTAPALADDGQQPVRAFATSAGWFSFLRGCHEKALSLDEGIANLTAYDEVITDPARARRLPQMTEVTHRDLSRERPRSMGDDSPELSL